MKLTQIAVIVVSGLLLSCTNTAASKAQTQTEAVKTAPVTTTQTRQKAVPDVAVKAPVQVAANKGSFEQYAASLKQEAIEKGYSKALVKEVFASLKHYQSAVVADKKQPEFIETLDTYLPKRISKQRIALARNTTKNISKSWKLLAGSMVCSHVLLSPCGGWKAASAKLWAIIRCLRL